MAAKRRSERVPRSGTGARERLRGVRVPIARLPGAADLPLPAPASADAAGLDLLAAVEDVLVLEPGARALVPTGIALAIPRGYEGQVRPRSGLALHHGIVLPNAPGTIDADYRGEVKVILLNASRVAFSVHRGDRIAQLVVGPVVRPLWQPVERLSATPRGAGGFGHSGSSAAPIPARAPRVVTPRRDGDGRRRRKK